MMNLTTTADLFQILGDPTRARLLWLLASEELTVVEITRVTGLTQSRVSSHLGRLREVSLVVDRPDGSCRYYSVDPERMDAEVKNAWNLLRATTDDPVLDQDRERVLQVLASRSRPQTWTCSVAEQMERHYSPGRAWEATAWGIVGLARLGDVLDVASGDGLLAELLAPRSRSVTCLDRSEKVIAAGKKRLRHLRQVRFGQGEMQDLPFTNGSFDQALLMNALTYSDDPAMVFREIHRVLRPEGTLVAVTLKRHGHRDALDRFNHVLPGFELDELREMLAEAGFRVQLCDVTSRERRPPHYEVITVHADRVDACDR
ncbi:MAG: metalloregulator ArsR/SmtB family transcription factor [Planctomycetota bacterium]